MATCLSSPAHGVHPRVARCAVTLVALAALIGSANPARARQSDPAADPDREIYRRVDRVKAAAGTIPEQARALARLTWLDPEVDSRTRALARSQLVGFGKHALVPIREVIREGAPPLRTDATMALIQAFTRITSAAPPDYLPGLEEALWFGPIEARRMALHALSRHRYHPALLPTIDTAYEFPVLRTLCIRSIARYQDDSARHFLKDVLESGTTEERRLAAAALASIGSRAFETLRDAVVDADAGVRDAAVEALLPYTQVDDLSVLYGYLEAAEGDGADRDASTAMVAHVRDRVEQLEDRVREELLEEMRTDEDAGDVSSDLPR